MIPQNCFVMTRKEVMQTERSLLFGHAMTDDAIIFGTDGLRAYEQEHPKVRIAEGRFSAIRVGRDYIRVSADRTGQDMLYLFRSGDEWAISNSFLLLVGRAARTHRLSFYTPAILGFHLNQGRHIGEQLIGHRTGVEEITIVPLTAQLKIDRRTGELEIQNRGYEDFYLGDATINDYDEIMHRAAIRGASILRAVKQETKRVNLFLSGGYDSRLVLGMLMASQDGNDRINIVSHSFRPDDYVVAKSLADRFGLALNEPTENRLGVSSSDALRLYLASCGSTYLPIYPVNAFRQFENASVNLTGDQPTGWSVFAGKGRFNGAPIKIRDSIAQDLSERVHGNAVADDFMAVFDDIDIDPESPIAMLGYYGAIRSRQHNGRHWYRSQGVHTLVTPLMHSDFVRLDLLNAERGAEPSQIFADFFRKFGDWALEEPFETADRAFDADMVSGPAPRRLDENDLVDAKVYGSTVDAGHDAGIFEPPLAVNNDAEEIKDMLAKLFERSGDARATGIFTLDDVERCKQEIERRGALNLDYRRTAHFVCTSILHRMIST